jgi:hypothetical protein
VSSRTFLVESLLSLPGFSGLPPGELPLDNLVSNTLAEGFTVLSAVLPNIMLGKLLGNLRRGGGFRPPLVVTLDENADARLLDVCRNHG